ncbi:MAG: type II secretion system F family protein [Gemmataceae bacterium]|nr:type II secretion system F family protein [Gemmataceae bacterium]
MFSRSPTSLSNMAALCHAFRVEHNAGMTLVEIFQQQARKGPISARPLIARVAERLKEGDSLEDALKAEGEAFPPLFVSMAAVGEQTGNLPEVFHELEKYYRAQLTLWREFIAHSVWPMIQLIAAIIVITLLILILGWLSDNPERAFDPLGFGVGPAGALKFLATVFLFFGTLVLIYLVATRAMGQKAAVHRLLLKIPVIGPCLQAIALSRLARALKLTMDSTLAAHRAVQRSLLVSGNSAYEACADTAATQIKRGREIADVLRDCDVFPEEFLQAIHTGEQTGELPEVMARQAEYYQEEAGRRLRTLTIVASFLVWLFVAALIIWAIFRIALSIFGVYQDAMRGL